MPSIVQNLPSLSLTSSTGPTNAIGHLDDASSIGIFLMTSAAFASSALANITVQVSQFDPADPFPQSGITQSSGFFSNLSTSLSNVTVSSSGQFIYVSPVAFRGLRLASFTSGTTNEVVAFVTKQLSV
jgi:hypothetical protein